MTGTFLAIVVAATSIGAGESELAVLRRLYGSVGVSKVTGNGGLTVGIARDGRIGVCRWPSPSSTSQVTFHSKPSVEGAVDARHAIRWGIESEGSLSWFGDADWTVRHGHAEAGTSIVRSLAEDAGGSKRLVQTVVVHPQRDAMAVQLSAEGFAEAPEFYWYANFTPRTRRLPEWPAADWGAIEALDDFAAFVDRPEGVVYHFRPKAPSSEQWKTAERLAVTGAKGDDWAEFGEGTWIAYFVTGNVIEQSVGSDTRTPTEIAADRTGPGVQPGAAVGQTYSAARMLPVARDGAYVGTVFIGFGPTMESARNALRETLAEGFAGLYEAAASDARGWLERAQLPTDADAETAERLREALLLIRTCMDRTSGSVVRSPIDQPRLSRDWPRHGAWISYALDLAGYREEAERLCHFYAAQVRRSGEPGQPLGSMPAALYGDGSAASPGFILETEATSWMLWSMVEHGRFSDDRQRAAFYESVWEAVDLSGYFLASWADSQGAPLHSFDPVFRHDARTVNMLAVTHAGIVSALELAAGGGREVPPDWQRRKVTLDVLLQNQFLGAGGKWPPGYTLPITLTAIPNVTDGDTERLLGDAIKRQIAGLDGLDPYDAAFAVATASVVMRHRAEWRTRLRPYVESVLRRVLGEEEGAIPDAAAAALAFVAVKIVFE